LSKIESKSESESKPISEIYDRYTVEIAFRDKIYGGIPKDPSVMINWLVSRAKMTKEEAKEKAAKIAEEVKSDPEALEKGVTTFKRDIDGLYIEERQVKAMLREAAQTTGLLSKYGMRDLIAHAMFTRPDKTGKIHLLRDGKKIVEEDGFEERALHVMTPRGPRDALKRGMYVEKPHVSFTLLVTKPVFKPKPKTEQEDPKPKKPVSPQAIEEETLHTLFQVAQEIGLGADRSQGEGKFDLIRFEAIH